MPVRYKAYSVLFEFVQELSNPIKMVATKRFCVVVYRFRLSLINAYRDPKCSRSVVTVTLQSCLASTAWT